MTEQTGEEWGFVKGMRDLVCGSIAGVAQAYTGQPMDTVKTRVQTLPDLYRGPVDCLKQTITKEGPLRLWTGSVPMASACLLENAVLLAGYGQCQAVIRAVSGTNDEGKLSHWQLGMAGGLGGVIAGFVLSPTELIKCRLQVAGLQQLQAPRLQVAGTGIQVAGLQAAGGHVVEQGAMSMTMHILNTEGIRGIFRGLTYTWFRDVPANAMNFFAYEATRSWLAGKNGKVSELPAWKLILAGGMGGSCAWTISYPMDVLKSRVQTTSGETPSITYSLVNTWRQEGGYVFVRGMTPSILRGFVSYAALFLAYERSGQWFDYYVLKKNEWED